jgi:hypothetical protein
MFILFKTRADLGQLHSHNAVLGRAVEDSPHT